jgi:Peptidase family S41
MTQFTEQTTDGLKKAISDITGKVSNDKLKGYILDLRNNPGGLLHYHLIKDHLDLVTRKRRFTRRLSKSKHSFAVLVFEDIFAAPGTADFDECIFVGRFDCGANRHLVRTDARLIPHLAHYLISALGNYA